MYFVANINGNSLAKDGNGFISRLTRDGKVESLKFIAGGRGGVTLNAPKGEMRFNAGEQNGLVDNFEQQTPRARTSGRRTA